MSKTFDQTTFSDRNEGTYGDCTRACVRTLAAIMDLPDMPDLPHPVASTDNWNPEFFKVLEDKYGLELRHQPVRPGKDYSFLPRICAVGGDTERTSDTGASHMVVYDREKREVFHDPHPSRAGVITIDGFYWLQQCD